MIMIHITPYILLLDWVLEKKVVDQIIMAVSYAGSACTQAFGTRGTAVYEESAYLLRYEYIPVDVCTRMIYEVLRIIFVI